MGCSRVGLTALFLWVAFGFIGVSGVWSQISWTPIYVDTTNRLDLWTISSTGCDCPGGAKSSCACCVKPGGCLCSFNPNKCAQCGLEDACQRFCNVSISSRSVATRSGLSWVHLKSPELEGPTSCWWRLHSAPGQRIEVQIHRLVSVGTFDNTTQKCSGGFLQFADGDVSASSSQAIQLCAQNSRFSPPVVLFGDQGTATLLLRIDGKTTRSQLLAYVSFSSADDPSVGDPSKGGRLRSHSVCDWTYENCWQHDCVIASPGYPGLFPPHRRCRYFLSANSSTDKIRIRFHVLSFPPPPLCSTHHIAIWKRNVSNLASLGAPWKTLCQESDISIEIEGGQALVEFRSGSTTSPYLYNGFKATVQFVRSLFVSGGVGISAPAAPQLTISGGYGNNYSRPTFRPFLQQPTTPSYLRFNNEARDHDNTEEPLGYPPRASYEGNGIYPVNCGHIFEGKNRGNVFRLIVPRDVSLPPRGGTTYRGFGSYIHSGGPKSMAIPPGPFKCILEFRGNQTDVVQLAVFNYKFRGPNCSTLLEVYDMEEESGNHTERLLGKLCGPNGNEVKKYTSSHSKMALIILIWPHEDPLGTEFLEGAFRFHDESIEGTVKPMSSCEVVYYGVTSSQTGEVVGPPESPLLRLSTFPLVCAHSFLPSPNQSVSLTLNRAGHDMSAVAQPGSKKYCRTVCGPSGCRCEAKYTPLDQIDHLLLVAGSTPIGCLCGFFPNALPMTFESHNQLTLVYHATKGGREFSYSAAFHFKTKITCSNFTIGPPSGSKRWREILGPEVVSTTSRGPQHYMYFQCIWSISIPHRYKLTVDFVSEENEKDCNTWNLTLWAGNNEATEPSRSDLLYSFCPKHGRKEFKVPDTVQNAFIKLVGVTLRPPQFEVRWKYVDVMITKTEMANGAVGLLGSARSQYLPIPLIIISSLIAILYGYHFSQDYYYHHNNRFKSRNKIRIISNSSRINLRNNCPLDFSRNSRSVNYEINFPCSKSNNVVVSRRNNILSSC